MMYYNDNYFRFLHRTIVGKIIIICTLIFILNTINVPVEKYTFQDYFGLNPSDVLDFKIWQLFTYIFVHDTFLHLFFNMFVFFMFGLELERIWGGKELLRYFIIVGMGAAVFSFFFVGDTPTIIIGSSGAVFGVFLAYGLIYPERYILIFFVFPLKMKYALVIFTLISLVLSFDKGSNIAHFTHLGGIIIGYLYLRRNDILRKWNYYLISQAEKKQHEKHKKLEEKIDKTKGEVDRLLSKISEEGLQSLTDKERDYLIKASKLINEYDEK